MRRFAAIFIVLIAILPALAQDKPDAEQEKSALLTYVEEQLSTPNRKISFWDIEGVLSSDAKVGRITIADREGVWLQVNEAEIVWTRSALLTGRLVVDKLAAKSIEVSRQPLPEEGAAPSPEASGFTLPELPVSVNLGELAIESVTFGEGVFGLASELAVKGEAELDTGKLDTALEITRLDGPGGELDLKAAYSGETGVLDLDLTLFEPEDGVIANLANFHERPSISLGLKGSGPVDGLRLALTLDAAEQRVLTGQARFAGSDEGRRFDIGAAGPVGKLVEPALRDLFGERSELILSGVARDSGETDIERLSIASGALTIDGSVKTAADGFPLEISLDGTIQSATGAPVVLPLPGGETQIGRATLEFNFGGGGVTTWSGNIATTDFATAGLTAQSFTLNLGGAALALETPAEREVTFVIDGRADGLGSENAAIAEAVGERIDLDISGAWNAGQPVTIDRASLDATAIDATFAGQIADLALDGEFGLAAADVTVLSAALDRDLAGSAEITARGKVEPVTGAFDLALDGTLTDFATGSAVDGLLTGTTVIKGRAGRDETGLSAKDFAVSNPRFSLRADGLFGSDVADFVFRSEITELNDLAKNVTGKLAAEGSAKGADGIVDLAMNVTIDGGTVLERSLSDASLSFSGRNQKSGLTGKLEGLAFIGGERVDLATDIAVSDGVRWLNNLQFNAGATRLTGTIAANADGLFDGELGLKSNDISTAAALFLTEARGKVDAEIALNSNGGRQAATVAGNLSSVMVTDVALGSGEVDLALTDLFGVPGADGKAVLREFSAGGMDISVLTATASKRGETTDFEAGARFDNGASLATAGALAAVGDGYRLTLTNADLVKDRLLASLTDAATVNVANGGFSIDGARFAIEGGVLNVRGSAGEQFDLSADLQQVPLGVANAIRPDLALSGTVSGEALVTGAQANPEVTFDFSGTGLSSSVVRDAGLQPFEVTATGNTTGEQLQVDAKLSNASGIEAAAKGSVPLGKGALALDVALRSFPLAVVDRVAGRQGLGGTLSGEAQIGGPIARPTAQFALRGTGVRANALTEAGLSALEIGANGSFAGETLTLTSFNATDPTGLAVSGSGRVPLSGSGLNVSLEGGAPLSLANRQLASRGARVGGTARFALRIAGSARNPAISGRISTDDASYADPLANLALSNIGIVADLDGERVLIRQGSARIAAGGGLSLAGSVSLNAAAGYPADLNINLDDARYTDGSLVVATISGRLQVTGAMIYDPLISGSLTVNRAELTIPETIAGGAGDINVKHINPPRKVARTLEFARADDGTPVPSGRPSVARLNISVNAPNRIFVRGRGLDSELGGSVQLTGPVTNIQPVGGFQLIRGRLSILGKRIVFDEGKVTLVGDLDPFLNFVASSSADGATVFITVTGRASDPAVVFSAQPKLPQDEVMARLIFGRSITELSALQVAKLAASAAQLAGGGGNSSLLDSFRQSTGLDELDVITDSGGNAAVRAGRYIQDNIYLGVEAGASGSTRGTINIDITDNLKATGSTGSDGDSSVGVFFEKDY